MELKYETMEVRIIDLDDLEELIHKTYGKKYDWVPSEEAQCQYYLHILRKKDIKSFLGEYEKGELEEFLETDTPKYYLGDTLLMDMLAKGVLEEGNYLLEIRGNE